MGIDLKLYYKVISTLKRDWFYTFKNSELLLFNGLRSIDPSIKIINITDEIFSMNQCNAKIIDSVIYFKVRYINKEGVSYLSSFINNNKDIENLIIDLRECLGGEIYSSIELAKILLGTFCFRVHFKEREVIYSNNDITKFRNIVGLIGESTLSAAELL